MMTTCIKHLVRSFSGLTVNAKQIGSTSAAVHNAHNIMTLSGVRGVATQHGPVCMQNCRLSSIAGKLAAPRPMLNQQRPCLYNLHGPATTQTGTLCGRVSLGGHQQTMAMSSLAQMHRRGMPKKASMNKKSSLEGNPFAKGIVLKVIIKKPKKPNSANRKCVRVKLKNGRELVAFIPGEGHNLQEHNMVLVRGGKKQDLPGVKHRVVRGKYDCNHVVKRTA